MMNTTKLIVGATVVVLGGIGIYAWSKDTANDQMMEQDAMMKSGENSMVEGGTVMMEGKDMMMEDAMMKAGSYEAYAPEKVSLASATHDVVLFFKADWCPTCIALDKDIRANLGKIPADLTILYVDYDNATDLKKKYGVTYQHTLVQVDKTGDLIKKWSGSPTLTALVTEAQ